VANVLAQIPSTFNIGLAVLWIFAVICVASTYIAISGGVDLYLRAHDTAKRLRLETNDSAMASVLCAKVQAWIDHVLTYTSIPLIKRIAHYRQSARKRRGREEVISDLPHMIDIITLSVAAGLPFDQALTSYVRATDGLLSHHFGLALQYWQTGLKLRSEALDDVVGELECREVARFVSALQQSLVLGTALVYVLEAQGSEARDAHKQHMETRIAKTPIKMLLPMATCIIPSLLLLLLGPVVIDVMRGLGSGV